MRRVTVALMGVLFGLCAQGVYPVVAAADPVAATMGRPRSTPPARFSFCVQRERWVGFPHDGQPAYEVSATWDPQYAQNGTREF